MDFNNPLDLDRHVKGHIEIGKFAEGIPYALKAIKLREQVLGPAHHDVAISRITLAQLYDKMGDFERAKPLYEEVLELHDRTTVLAESEAASFFTDLAFVYEWIGNFDEAEELLERALYIYEQTPDPHDQILAPALDTLGSFYEDMGNFEKARSLYKRALSIHENFYTPSKKKAITAIKDIVEKCQKTEPMSDALPVISDLLNSLQVPEPSSMKIGMSLGNLANLYRVMGDMESALVMSKRSLKLTAPILGRRHPQVAASLDNLADVFCAMGDYKHALPLYRRALNIREKHYAPQPRDIARSLHNLGALYAAMEDFEVAQSFHERALEIQKLFPFSNHPDVAVSLHSLAQLYHRKGMWDEALSFYKHAISIAEHLLGPEHPSVGSFIKDQGLLYQVMDKPQEALRCFERSLVLQKKYLESVFCTVATERQKLACAQSGVSYFYSYLSLLSKEFIQDNYLIQCGFEVTLGWKGLVLEAQSKANEIARNRLSQESRKDWDHRLALLGKLSQELEHAPNIQRRTSKVDHQRYRVLQEQVEDIEERLFKDNRFFTKTLNANTKSYENLLAELPRDAGLVEFIKIYDVDFVENVITKPRYLAFVLSHNHRVELIDLGSAYEIEQLVSKALSNIQLELNEFESESPRVTEGHIQGSRYALKTLFNKIWQPFEKYLSGLSKVYISPDGELNLLPFAAIMDSRGQYLIERYSLAYLTSGKQLLGQGKVQHAFDIEFLGVANPDFGFDPDCSNRFMPLPSSQKEVESILSLLPNYKQKQLLVGTAATKTALKLAKTPRVLHLATHGFFLQEQQGSEGLRHENDDTRRRNSLLRSGLVFAGANRRITAETTDDGYLTALEVSGMDLYGTELVVLSACRTGFGEVIDGEGVFGLRRAFALTGARNLMMSLWRISEEDTPHQVRAFYTYLQEHPPAEALRKAQLETIDSLRMKIGYAPVSLWAPFIMQGAYAFDTT